MMNDKKCGCFHHTFAKVLSIVGGIAALLFLFTAWLDTTVFGMDMTAYFEHVIVFTLVVWGTKMCKCCCDTGCGKSCDSGMCMPGRNE